MNCKSCGTPVGTQQQYCPNCGAPVGAGNIGSVPSVPSGFDQKVNVNEPSDIGFNRDMEQDLNQFGSNDPYMNRAGTMSKDNLLDQMGNGTINSQKSTGIYAGNMKLPDEGKKKKFPWFGIAIALVTIMVVGIVVLPQLNKFNLKIYEGDQYAFKYNANWRVDEEKEEMTLYYSDNNSRFIFNALSTFKALNSSIDNDVAKKNLYKQFYNAWSNIDGGELTGGTDTFLSLNEDSMYARVDYVLDGQENVGSFYVVISEENDKVISFMSYCTNENKVAIDEDILEMLSTLTYKSEAESSAYDKFKAGEVKEYMALGYMDYDVPECWMLDETRTKNAQYKSNVFVFMDEASLLEIKGVTPLNATTGATGTTYETMKAIVANSYGAVKEEKRKSINGKLWYVIVTPDYEAGGVSYHNEIYFTMSATNQHLYYLEAYVSNETSEKKTKYLNESIEYILESVELLNIDE